MYKETAGLRELPVRSTSPPFHNLINPRARVASLDRASAATQREKERKKERERGERKRVTEWPESARRVGAGEREEGLGRRSAARGGGV